MSSFGIPSSFTNIFRFPQASFQCSAIRQSADSGPLSSETSRRRLNRFGVTGLEESSLAFSLGRIPYGQMNLLRCSVKRTSRRRKAGLSAVSCLGWQRGNWQLDRSVMYWIGVEYEILNGIWVGCYKRSHYLY